MRYLTLAVICQLFVSCIGGVIPFPYPQRAMIPGFKGNISGGGKATVVVEGHDETTTVADGSGNFSTNRGEDIYFGFDQFYSKRPYYIRASIEGGDIGRWKVIRPPLIGFYPDRGVDVGTLSQ